MAYIRTKVPLVGALLFVSVVYASSLQTSIGASNDPFPDPKGLVGPLMDDSGEFVVAWHTWGVAHPPGYPFLNLTANLLTRLFGLLGANPVTAASLISYTFGVLTLAMIAWPIYQERKDGWGAGAAILLPAFGQMMWLYSCVAEVCTFALFLGFGAIALALALSERPSRNLALGLGFLVGLAFGHHRTLALLIPSIVVAAWPARRLGWKTWLGALGMAILSFGVYAYLPIVSIAGSPWVYGRPPQTLEGFLDAFLTREYSGQLTLVDVAHFGTALKERAYFLAREMTWLGLALGCVGLGIALANQKTRHYAIVFSIIPTLYFLLPISQNLIVTIHLPILMASLAFASLWGISFTATKAYVRWVQVLATFLVVGQMFVHHQSHVLAYTRDPLGERIVAAVAALEEEHPTIIEVWGPRYYALAYGKWASKELASIRLLDGRNRLEVLSTVGDLPPVLYTTEAALYLYGPEVWAERLGSPVALESAGDGLVAIRRAPRLADVAPSPGALTDVEIALDSASAWFTAEGDVRLTLEWRALRRPMVDYNVFVHIYGLPTEGNVEQLLAQGDRRHPVYGFYPTSQWSVGERVRDDYRIPLPKGSRPTNVQLGLYLIRPEGGFDNRAIWNVPVEWAAPGRE